MGYTDICMLDEITHVIKECGRFCVASHLGPEADAVGSQLAVRRILQELGKEAWAVLRDAVPVNLRFLPGSGEIRSISDVSQESIETWIVVDCGQLNRVGHELYELIKDHPLIVNIDHHRDNPRFGHVNWVQVTASTTMLIYELALHLGVEITPDLATCLYAGIVADTDSFRNANVDPEVLRVASELLGYGARARQVNVNLYERRKPGEMKLLGHTLAHARLRDGIIWYAIPQDVFKEMGADVNDTERLVEELRATEGVRVALLFKEMENGKIKVSLRAKDGLDVSRVARAFGGGGHQQAAGCLIAGKLEEVEAHVLDAVRRALQEHPHG